MVHSAYAQNSTGADVYSAVLPTMVVEASADDGSTKGYIGYGEAKVSRNGLEIRELPQTIDVINIQKNKNYNTNDLSSILEGNAGIDATYDMRGESIYLRGFNIDANDIYRDGIRESGQVRRSTASVERVEILKGPASVLYGRSGGGGVVNMVSKAANFQTARSIGITYGSWADRSANIDINQKISDGAAVRLIGEIGHANSFRSGIGSKSRMISPSITLKSTNGLSWTGQYIYDNTERIPDRGPNKAEYDKMGLSYRTGFARAGDKVDDTLHHFRSDLTWQISPDWSLQWLAGYRRANQNFDHYYGGSYNETTRLLSQTYAWQNTRNETLSSALTLNGGFDTGRINHKITAGWDISRENRHPILAVVRNQSIDPFDRGSWTRIVQRPAATTDNRHHRQPPPGACCRLVYPRFDFIHTDSKSDVGRPL
ncbi:TonB-dependent receptor plug domain-containing protein [Uruburuella testudinis]|uniref:TonB-dependent receptor plug domain-containing protein n=1 Tax=Uruburuella testudinis TaxID=1282863 RepID=A0ABY4DWG6_9NEIS|nr:TonB-dependent receptor plug domain-containing protein [Uruburuella testudinis]UOO83156.1 TonB-dependent receptor plug domain-containing protein [Uruburuella testudinis]